MNLGKFNILGLNITACDYNYIISMFQKAMKSHKKHLVGPLPVNQIMLAYLNKKFQHILNKFDFLVPDGIWVKNSLNYLYNLNLKYRIRGADLMLKICKISEKNNYKIYLFGSTNKVLSAIKDNLLSDFPNLKIVGYYSPPYRKLTAVDKRRLINSLQKLKVDVLFIALGTPAQEILAYEIIFGRHKINRSIAIFPVGAVFDFISGNKYTAPKLMQDSGFEWLFRLFCEPRRLWKRYLFYGTWFIFLIFLQKIKMGFKKYNIF